MSDSTVSASGRVVVVGSFNVDHVWALPALPRPGETLAGSYHTGPGGKGFNQATARARDAGGSTLLNPAPADSVASDALWALTDIATPNETEFCAQLQRRGGDALDPDALAGLDDAALHAHCRRLLAHGSVVITLGKSGCFVSHADGALRGDAQAFYRVQAAAVKAIDTTGAGDAFNGALAASLARDAQAAFAEHVRYAVRFAGLSTERTGAAAAMPSDAELRARFG